jgi:hypothetical protein
MRILLWHVHGSWTTAFVQGPHTYVVPVTPDRGPDGLGRARTWDWPESVVEVPPERLRDEEIDVVVLQRPHELALVDQWLGRRPPLVYRDDRPAFSAIALHADTSSTTAIANDYGVDEVFARQVRAHGRPGDVLMLLSTSGASANLLSAADAARAAGMRVWALTGPAPNPLLAGSDESLCVEAPTGATVQELHLVAVHMVCAAFDAAVARGTRRDGDGRR